MLELITERHGEANRDRPFSETLGRLALLPVLMFLGACTPEPSKTPVDLLLTNGVIIPGAPGAPEGNAMAVKDGRIVAVGGPELAERFIGTVTRDLEGQTVLPGFDDVHSHIHSYARRYIPLQKITSIEALKGAVQAKAGPGARRVDHGLRLVRGRPCGGTQALPRRSRRGRPGQPRAPHPGRGPAPWQTAPP